MLDSEDSSEIEEITILNEKELNQVETKKDLISKLQKMKNHELKYYNFTWSKLPEIKRFFRKKIDELELSNKVSVFISKLNKSNLKLI